MPHTKRIAYGAKNLNDLPEDLLSRILSFLPIEVAATTSLISKRWRTLFLFAPTLKLTYHEGANGDAFVKFVARMLALRSREKNPIEKFALHLVKGVDGDHVDGLILNALGHELSDLDLRIYNLDNWSGPSPHVFVAKELSTLVLGTNCIINVERGVVDLPNLKTLHLDDVQFTDDNTGLSKLLSGCPVLEVLFLVDINWDDWDVCCVSSTSLKKMRIRWESYDDDKDCNGCPKSVIFNTPNLQCLHYSDDDASQYPTANFGKLDGAKIQLIRRNAEEEEENVTGHATHFWKGICNVDTLSITSDTLEVLTFCCDPIPVFKNLTQLSIKTGPELGWESLPGGEEI
ncbi:Leucine-rich repeat 2 [Arabidopsis suecica]|uniref:Leucine-rich repeat 2 n=1 Tax=Arabidopsis suecica TaxID=45249 RepID=A0A8T1ZUK8_ARASU|nr:Leucine-rich repeat 2 [Arabidopsis suecica]